MADRRMFSCKITNSDAFKTMPLSAQALYFQLGMEADDDGFINNAMSVTRGIGATQDDIETLISNRFVMRMDKSILVIKHWRINNYIQKDRYHETAYTQYKDLLALKENGSYTEKDKNDPVWGHSVKGMYTGCIQNVSKMDTENSIGKDSIGKDRYTSLSKDSLVVGQETDTTPPQQEKTDLFGNKIEDEQETVPYKTIADYWNTTLKGKLPQIRTLTEDRKTLIRQRWYEYHNEIYQIIDKIASLEFFAKWKSCAFDWCFKKGHMLKIVEGNYNNDTTKGGRSDSKNFRPRDLNGQYSEKKAKVVTEL